MRAAGALGLVLALWCAFPTSALAWANGPQFGEGFGTHDWVLYHANQSAARQGYDWVDWATAQSASDDPDTVLRDSYYHVYDRTGDPYGDSPARASELYRQAVVELRSGDRIRASRTLGLLSHYLADTANPLHTDQTPAEKGMHARYEDAVDSQTGSPSADVGLLSAHSVVPTRDVKGLTVRLASDAHDDYIALVTGYTASGDSPQVQAITERSLNAAVGGVADAIAGIGADAGDERGAGSPASGTAQLIGVVWCAVGMALGALLVATIGVILLLRRR
jgi:hypothetical protein